MSDERTHSYLRLWLLGWQYVDRRLAIDEMAQRESCDALYDKACSKTGITQRDWCAWFGCSLAYLGHAGSQHALLVKINAKRVGLTAMVKAKIAIEIAKEIVERTSDHLPR